MVVFRLCPDSTLVSPPVFYGLLIRSGMACTVPSGKGCGVSGTGSAGSDIWFATMLMNLLLKRSMFGY